MHFTFKRPITLAILMIFVNSMRAQVYEKKILLISMDGFRWDYLDRVDTPNFDKFAKEGIKAPYINGPFVTKTFPSHFTIATGLYEESHGITGNNMYDSVLNAIFSIRYSKDKRWWQGGEPIWVTVRKNNMKSGTFFFPGSEVEIKGYRPNIWKKYYKATPFYERVDVVMGWFIREKLDMITLYFFEPDHTGHVYGPDSPQINEKVKEMDKVLGYLMEQLKANGLDNKVNVILTSDHGMASMSVNKIINLADYIDLNSDVDDRHPFISRGPTCQIIPAENKTMEVYNKLKSAHPNMTVYLKEDIPDHFHYKNNRRIHAILTIADEGWSISPNKTNPRYRIYDNKGNHGYDNRLMSMKPIFLARGPNFKANVKTEVFNSVDIYPLMCELMGLTPAPNNGTLDATKKYLRDTPSCGSPNTSIYSTLMILLALIIIL